MCDTKKPIHRPWVDSDEVNKCELKYNRDKHSEESSESDGSFSSPRSTRSNSFHSHREDFTTSSGFSPAAVNSSTFSREYASSDHNSEEASSESDRSLPSPRSTRSCSVHSHPSEDFTENNSSLNMLSKFVSTADQWGQQANTSKCHSSMTADSNSPYVTSAYNNYPQTIAAAGFGPASSAFSPYQPLHHVLSAYHQYVEAANIVSQQDRATKQIKKLRPKKFKCEYCNVAFSNNGQLKGHVRIHTGERPFKCDAEHCGKTFTRNEELTRHKKIHTGLRPFSCHQCDKKFGRKDHLKKHKRSHENRGPWTIPHMDNRGGAQFQIPLDQFVLGHHLLSPVGSLVYQY